MNKPRHVIWITTDHLRWDDLGGNGFDHAHTPHIDSLIASGISFSNCFCQSPVCMPSRSSFMTGCYPQQSGVIGNGRDLDPNFPTTVARLFKNAGYQTAQIGKLHFESHEDNDLDPRARSDYGFDIFWCDEEPGCYDGPYMKWLFSERPDLIETFRIARPVAPHRSGEAKRPTVLDAPWEYSFSGWIAQQSKRYLAAWGGNRGRKEQHFLHLGFYAPHPPLNPTADMMQPLAGKSLRTPIAPSNPEQAHLTAEEIDNYNRHFAGMVVGIDYAVGDVIKTLKELGVYEDTLIVFTSDHGDFCGDHGLVSKGPAWYDGVARVPLIFHWPNGLKHTGQVDGLFELIDCLPTMLELCGQAIPRQISGGSWAQQLMNGNLTAVDRDDVYATIDNHQMLRSKDFKYLRYYFDNSSSEVLYELRNDPDELQNVADHSTYAETLSHLRERLLNRLVQATEPITSRCYWF